MVRLRGLECLNFCFRAQSPGYSPTNFFDLNRPNFPFSPLLQFPRLGSQPQLPRKTRLVATPRSAVERPTSRAQPKQPTPDCKSRKKLDLGYETEQNLIEQINELTRVHTSQLLEKDLELAALQRELADLRAEMSKAEKNHVADYNTMKQSYEKAIEKMKTELEELVKRAEVEKSHTEEFVGELKSKVGVLQQNLDNSNAICNDLEYQLAEANISLVEVKNEYADLEKELKRYKDSINELINRKAKDIESAESSLPEKLEEACAAAQLNVEDLLKKMQESLKALEREIEVERMETHMKFTGVIDSISAEVEDRVELFEQKSKSLQEVIKVMAGEFQSKINDIVDSIAETADINERKLRENLLLTEELEKSKAATVEQKIIVVDLQGKMDELQRKLNQLTSQCRKYEIVQAEATKTIHVLSERLFESETEVERLNDKTEELTLRKDALEGKVKSVVDENNVLKMDINNLQVSLVRGVKEVEMALLAKVESYRRHSVEETQRMKLEVDSKQGTIDMLKNEIEYLRAKAAESAEYLNMCQTRINNYKQEIAAMSQKLATEEMERLVNTKIDDLTAENEELSSNIKKLTEDIVDKDLKIGSMAQELEEAKIYNQNLTSRISSLANELEAKESQFDELAQEVEVKNMTMVQVSDEYEKMKEMYENECRKLEVVEQDHITTIALMEAELRQEQSLSLQLGGSLSAMKSKMADIEANAKDLVNVKCTLESKVHDLEQQLSKASEDIKVLTNEKEDLMELVNRQWEERELFSSQIQAQQEEISELKQMRDDRLDEEKAIYQAELQNEIFALQQNLEDTQRHAIDLQGRNDELIFKLNSVESELSAAETEKERHECEVKDLVEKMSSLEVRCAAAEKRKSEYKKYATQLESEKKSLADQLSEVNEEKEKLQDEKRELSMQLTSTSARLADQEIRTRETETRCRELETLAEPTQKQLAAYEAERSAMLEKSTSLENELEALTKVHAKIVGHQNHRQKIHRVQQIIDTNSKLKQENEKLLVENAKLRTALQDAAKKGKSKAFKDVRDKENDSTKCTANPQPPQSPLKVRNAPN